MSAPAGISGYDLFARHLDLAPLHGRSRGLVRCIFHPDSSPSLSVDLERGLFHCFACDAKGGLRAFAERVGEISRAPQQTRPAAPRESLLQEARRRAAQQARRNEERAAEWAPWYACNDAIRRSDRAVDCARAMVSRLGADHPRTWRLLELAAKVEQNARAFEADLDAILASGRIA